MDSMITFINKKKWVKSKVYNNNGRVYEYKYNNSGDLIKVIGYIIDEDGTKSQPIIRREYEYHEESNKPILEINYTVGNMTINKYNTKGEVYYNEVRDIKTSKLLSSNIYTYNSLGDELTSTTVSYTENDGERMVITLAAQNSYVYNEDNKIITHTINKICSNAPIEIVSDNMVNKTSSSEYSVYYEYDERGNMTRSTLSDLDGENLYEYDDNNNNTKTVVKFYENNILKTEENYYKYDENNNLIEISTPEGVASTIEYIEI